MKRVAAFLLLAVLPLSSCLTQSKYHVYGVDVEIDVNDVSSGYVRADFSTSRDAYYVTGCIPVESEYDPVNKAEQFMTLMVDSLYRNYLDWRYEYLKDQEDYIADFASHSLQYGDSERYFQGLSSNTSYWIYAFVVNPDSKEPSGRLFLKSVTTVEYATTTLWFDTRVQGSYLYLYPRNSEGGDIVENVPYTGGLVDSVSVAERFPFPSDSTFRYSLDCYCNEQWSNAYTYGILSNITYTGIRQRNLSGELEQDSVYYIYIGELNGGIIGRTYWRFSYDKTAWVQDVSLYYRQTPASSDEETGETEEIP